MYVELKEFLVVASRRRELWTSEELWTSVVVGVLSFWCLTCFDIRNQLLEAYRVNVGNILTAVSILFGFTLSSYFHSINIVNTWGNKTAMRENANQFVDWNAWTVLCMLSLIMYLLLLLIFNNYITNNIGKALAYSCLNFAIVYCILQLVCHTLTTWYLFRKRDIL